MKYLPRYFKIYFVFQTYCEANNIALTTSIFILITQWFPIAQ